jgi:hypothetical protein
MEESTILIKKDLIEKMKSIKEYPSQTYNDLLEKMISSYLTLRKKNQYDEFLHKIQQPKMKELWDNKEDEAWENA